MSKQAYIKCYKGSEVTHKVIKDIINSYTLADFQDFRIKFINSYKDIFTRFETEFGGN